MAALPLVSIVTPAYNRASYLDETIRSVLEQDYPNMEYVVLDDGSTDNTRDLLGQYSGRLIWETHPNMGEHRTVNKGWTMTHGEILAVVNSDDTLLPGAVSAAVAFMQARPDILVAYPDWNDVGPKSEFLAHVHVPEYDYLFMLKHCLGVVGPGAFMRRRAFDLAGVRDPSFKWLADFEYWLRLGLYGQFAHIPMTLATWRVHGGSAWASGSGKAMADEFVRVLDKLYARPDLPPPVRGVRREAYGSAHYCAAMTAGEAHWEARKHCLRSILYHPHLFLGNRHIFKTTLSVVLPKPLDTVVIRCGLAVGPPIIRAYRSLGRAGSRRG
jgi:glycosyltransferase involved in cell wall biosynthesis